MRSLPRVFGGAGSWRDTTRAYLVWFGVSGPVLTLLLTPIYCFAPLEDWVHVVSPQFLGPASNLPPALYAWAGIVFICLVVALIAIPFRWLSRVHGVTLGRVVVATVGVQAPILYLHTRFVASKASDLVDHVAAWLDLIV